MSSPTTSVDVEDGEIVSSEQEESSGAEEEPARKRRRRTAHDFIQDVEVDDNEEDEDVDYTDDDIMMDPAERREAERAIREQEQKNERPSYRDKLAKMSEEEIGRYFEARHAQESHANRSINDEMLDSISQNSHLPTYKDPQLWIVKVRKGEEKATTL
ncbi:hypothetical protein M3Y98_00030400 [Aphelenchoides besseyi]|nr:hypothetical protein M3Y98_00030400 [Aphelenchoides besseyi]